MNVKRNLAKNTAIIFGTFSEAESESQVKLNKKINTSEKFDDKYAEYINLSMSLIG
jgi:hypothetical protein